MLGPFPLVLENPAAGKNFLNIFGTLGEIPGLPLDARETAILAVGARYQAGYELYAHGNVAVKKLGMSRDVIDQIASGSKPQALNEQCSLAYDAARYLVDTPGKLSQELWDQCIKTFGRQGTIALVHYVGSYAYTCILLNAMDAPVPEE